MSTSLPVDQETVETDEGIGESETDVASSTDADASCPSVVNSDYQHLSSVTSSPPTCEDEQQHSQPCDIQTSRLYSCETNPVSAENVAPDDNETQQTLANISAGDQNCSVDITSKLECLPDSEGCETSQSFSAPKSASVDDQGCVPDTVELDLSEESSETYDVPKSSSPSDDDPALSEDSGSSQTLSVTQSSSLNDDDQGSLTDVTETAHSDDSGSSRTVEVGDDDVPQLLDDDEVDAVVSSPTDTLIPDTVELGCPSASSQSPEMTAGTSSWAAKETVDCAKDVTLAKESGEDWDDEPMINLKADDDTETTCKYNYCFVQKSAFPLGYERSKSVLISVIIIISIVIRCLLRMPSLSEQRRYCVARHPSVTLLCRVVCLPHWSHW